MRRSLPAIIVVFLILSTYPSVQASPTESPFCGKLLITAIMPASSTEFICIRNVADTPLSLGGLDVTDGEGVLSIPYGTMIQPGEELVISNGGETFLGAEGRIFLSIDDMERSGRFVLADKGDWVHLLDGDTVIDTFVYGDVDKILPGWSGPPFDRIGRYKMAVRTSINDTNSSHDWGISVPGRSSFPEESFLAEVEGFLFPDNGFPIILRELYSAQKSIDLALYQFDNTSLMSLLASLSQRGVDVNILLEGSPVGGISESTAMRIKTMEDAGCTIRLLRSDDGYKRYDYMHSKYAVIDGVKVLLTSENWRTSVFEGNRGWGVVVHSSGLASYLERIFLEDFDLRHRDVVSFTEYYSHLEADNLGTFPLPQAIIGYSYVAMVSVALGPDHGMTWLETVMREAESRLYSQQFYCRTSWLNRESPLSWMRDAGAEGVDVRLLLDSSPMGDTDGQNTEIAKEVSAWEGCMAKTWEGVRHFSLQHNKGVVTETVTVVGSFNWVDTSFINNRELAFCISSPELADFFTDAFLFDWSTDPYPPVAVLDFDDRLYKEGETVVLMANRSYDNNAVVSWEWDFNGDGETDKEGSRVLWTAEKISGPSALTVRDTEGNSDTIYFSLSVESTASKAFPLHIPIIGSLFLAVLWKVVMMWRVKEGGQEAMQASQRPLCDTRNAEKRGSSDLRIVSFEIGDGKGNAKDTGRKIR